MKINFKDFYGQHIELSDETASGNVRVKVNTMRNMNDLPGKKPEACELETDISLDERQLGFLIESLSMMVRTDK